MFPNFHVMVTDNDDLSAWSPNLGHTRNGLGLGLGSGFGQNQVIYAHGMPQSLCFTSRLEQILNTSTAVMAAVLPVSP